MKSEFPVYWKETNGSDRSGYIDPHGRLLREFAFLRVTKEGDGVAFYTEGKSWAKGLLWGLMKADGTRITAPRFTSHQHFKERLAVAAENEDATFSFVFGYLNVVGHWQIAPRFIAANSFSEGAAYVKQGEQSELCSLIGPSGEILIDRFSLGCGFLKEGLAKAYDLESRRFGFRDRNGNWKIGAKFTGAHDFSEGLAAVLEGVPGKETVRFVDQYGAVMIKPSKYSSVEGGFSEGLACVYRSIGRAGEVLAGYIDKNGDEVIPCRWGLGTPFSEGLAAVMDNETRLWGYINTKGEVVISPRFGAVEPYSGGLAKVRQNKRIGPDDYLDTSGNLVWKAGTRPKL